MEEPVKNKAEPPESAHSTDENMQTLKRPLVEERRVPAFRSRRY